MGILGAVVLFFSPSPPLFPFFPLSPLGGLAGAGGSPPEKHPLSLPLVLDKCGVVGPPPPPPSFFCPTTGFRVPSRVAVKSKSPGGGGGRPAPTPTVPLSPPPSHRAPPSAHCNGHGDLPASAATTTTTTANGPRGSTGLGAAATRFADRKTKHRCRCGGRAGQQRTLRLPYTSVESTDAASRRRRSAAASPFLPGGGGRTGGDRLGLEVVVVGWACPRPQTRLEL